ncbi:MAG: alpha/beta hydrolase [Coriobacteriia bacterium]
MRGVRAGDADRGAGLKRALLRALASGALVLALAAAAFLVWAHPPLGPGERALTALESGDGVSVTHTDHGWVFLPESEWGVPATGLVFYPGGRVDARSYAPFARALAAEGHAVVVVEVPLSFAVLEVGAANDVIASPQLAAVTRWAVGGHSLGGAMAAQYIADTPQSEVEGLLLLAAYPPSGADLSGSGVSVTDVTATLDGVLDRENWVAGRALLPENAFRVSISGGNHAGFGDYGEQPGDTPATCTPEEQLLQTVRAADELLQRM